MREVRKRLGSSVTFYAGAHQLDPSVKTSIDASLYTPTGTRLIARRFLLQTGHIAVTLRADTAILDLNPRNLTVWPLLVIRRVLRRRTLLWGHLHPRAGASSKTAILRRTMRRLANGTILYGYDSVLQARLEVSNSPVWVAPNSLHPARDLGASRRDRHPRILCVGRLVASKKVDLLVRAFAASELHSSGIILTVVGEGAELQRLQLLSQELDVGGQVEFVGQVSEPSALIELYADALCSVSAGYVGLSLTQSLGFGVPMLVSRDELHSPEIELERFGGVTYFQSDSVISLADALRAVERTVDQRNRQELGAAIKRTYSAESMAEGLIRALENRAQDLGEDGWPLSQRI